jgi:hypothetical protein
MGKKGCLCKGRGGSSKTPTIGVFLAPDDFLKKPFNFGLMALKLQKNYRFKI